MTKRENMTANEVLALYHLFEEQGISVWIDGGWGVDALLGKQTREHADLDIAVHRKDNDRLRQLIENCGYKAEKRMDSSEFMYVMRHAYGQSIDIHVFEYDENGKNTYGIEYPFGSLTGKGKIAGQEVNCIESSFLFQFKTGYEPKEKDIHDVRALCEKFSFELPSEYAIKNNPHKFE
ncbi:2''-aminoglycoside nucleotidyltransferase [Pilibacter termitis]|uniref:2''-aminoglycoside nucleotidyltransferase n=1 Tax=Pilibacter termitis TaxID=263852 RepID=A0A1T4R816_9ENTE|nr:nucleotidyltransferase family protein [Pilibacter termitis]SKA11761.1 2''-aminoglycoside nucleotidyltransferase [Pilibacter termitis]